MVIFIFAFAFIDKVGKNRRIFLVLFFSHLVTLHVSLVFIQLLHNEFLLAEKLVRILTYVAYYCLVGCFAWLFVLFDDVWHNSRLYKNIPEIRRNELIQDWFRRHTAYRIKFYYVLGVLVPLLISVFPLIVFETLIKQNNETVTWMSNDLDVYKNYQTNYVVLPFMLFLVFATVRCVQTYFFVRKMIATNQNETDQELQIRLDKIKLEKKRFAAYVRFFIVMLLAWGSFMIFDSIKTKIIFVLNILYLIMLITLLNKRNRRNLNELYESFRR